MHHYACWASLGSTGGKPLLIQHHSLSPQQCQVAIQLACLSVTMQLTETRFASSFVLSIQWHASGTVGYSQLTPVCWQSLVLLQEPPLLLCMSWRKPGCEPLSSMLCWLLLIVQHSLPSSEEQSFRNCCQQSWGCMNPALHSAFGSADCFVADTPDAAIWQMHLSQQSLGLSTFFVPEWFTVVLWFPICCLTILCFWQSNNMSWTLCCFDCS